ncbi:MAG TPA: type VII secretion-associated serine protease mycosin [Actinocatenispora sp.]
MSRRLPALLLAAGIALTPAVLVPAGAVSAAPACQASAAQVDYVPWQAKRVATADAWKITRGAGVTVAVIDSGVNARHPTLRGRVDRGTDLARGEGAGDSACLAHGSTVAGIIAGRQLDGSGFAGMAPEARILPIRITEDADHFSDGSQRVAAAIRYAVDHGATVVNLSLTSDDSSALRSAVRYAHRRGVVLVAATGNDGRQAKTYPAAYPEVIAVTGTADASDTPDPQSNTGDYVDLAAPSLNIVGPGATGDGFVLFADGGTSFSTPFVAGAAALVRAYRPDLSPDEVARRLEATADHPADGHDARVGYGVVNPYRAVTAVLGRPGTSAPARGALPVPGHRAAPANGSRATYLWASGGLLVAVLVLLVAVVVVPRGTRRGWRPGLLAALPGPWPTRRRYPTFDPASAPRDPPRAVAPARVTSTDPSGSFTVDVTFR